MRSPPVSSKARLAALRIDWPSAAFAPGQRHQHRDPVAGLVGRQPADRPRARSASSTGSVGGGGAARACAARSRRSRTAISAAQQPASFDQRRDALAGGGLRCHDDAPHERQARTRPLYRRDPDRQSLRSESRAPPRCWPRADLIAVEDSRVTAKLLRHIGVKRPMPPYHDHNADEVRPGLIARMASEAVALVSDAGTPLISDPGYKLVRDARAAGIDGRRPSPARARSIAALTLAGLPTDRFAFFGFLPAKAGARATAIAEAAAFKGTLVFYESGPRLAATPRRAARRPRRPRGGGGARDQQEVRGDGDRHASPSSPRAMPTRRPRARSSSSSARPARRRPASEAEVDAALREAMARLSALARRGRGRGAARPAEARRLRARAAAQMKRADRPSAAAGGPSGSPPGGCG